MSYDCYMVYPACPTCERDGNRVRIGNMTSNVSPMWAKALGGVWLSTLEGMTGEELVPILEAAVRHISDPANAAEYAAMNPSNGWGSHGSAARYLEDVLKACAAHPTAKLEVSC